MEKINKFFAFIANVGKENGWCHFAVALVITWLVTILVQLWSKDTACYSGMGVAVTLAALKEFYDATQECRPSARDFLMGVAGALVFGAIYYTI